MTGKIYDYVPVITYDFFFGSANLLEGIFADDSCILGHVASLCERDMSLVAMGLLRVAISVLSPSSGTINIQKYVSLFISCTSLFCVSAMRLCASCQCTL